MAALVSYNGGQGEVLHVRIALERLGIHSQQILVRCTALAVLGSSALAVNVTVFNNPHETEPSCDSRYSGAPGTELRSAEGSRERCRHARSLPTRSQPIKLFVPAPGLQQPEIAQDFEREERLMEASGMKDPDYKHGGKFKVVPPKELARILKLHHVT